MNLIFAITGKATIILNWKQNELKANCRSHGNNYTSKTENVDIFKRLFLFRSNHLLHPLTSSFNSTAQKSYVFLFWRPQGNVSKQKHIV